MSKTFEEEYSSLAVKFLKTSLREQFLILLCGIVIILLGMYSLVLEPQLSDIEKINQSITTTNTALAKQLRQIDNLSQKLQVDPNTAVTQRIDTLEGEAQRLTRQLQSQTNKLVPANKMADMLERILTNSTGLTLITLDSIAPVPLLAPDDESIEGLYRHGIRLVFKGNYFDIQLYLEKLESLEWQFYWKKFEYLVNEYPVAKVELEIYTLSTSSAFIGVSKKGASD